MTVISPCTLEYKTWREQDHVRSTHEDLKVCLGPVLEGQGLELGGTCFTPRGSPCTLHLPEQLCGVSPGLQEVKRAAEEYISVQSPDDAGRSIEILSAYEDAEVGKRVLGPPVIDALVRKIRGFQQWALRAIVLHPVDCGHILLSCRCAE
jgi:hypothetical protein